MNLLRMALLVTAFAAVGYLTGWLVGGSSTPVVAALLPLVFGLLTGIGVGYAEAAAKLRDLRAMLSSTPPPSHDQLLATAGANHRSVAALGSVVVIAFCTSCYVGVLAGIDLRVPSYPAVSQVIGSRAEPTFEELAEIHRLRRGMQVRNMPREDFEEVVQGVVIPLLRDQSYAPGGELADFRRTQLAQLVDKVIGPDVARSTGRGPASEREPGS